MIVAALACLAIGGAGFEDNARVVVVAFLGHPVARRTIHHAGFTPADIVQDAGDGHLFGVEGSHLFHRFGEGWQDGQ